MLAALLWDVDGTLAETERDGHRVAFNQAFEALGLRWHWDHKRYGRLLRVTGGRERLLAAMAEERDAPPTPAERQALARKLHDTKNHCYARLVYEGGIALRGGVAPLIHEARAQGVRQAIVTTTSRANVETLLARQLGPAWADMFDAVLCGEDVRAKKPDPEVYLLALRALRLQPRQALALEDSGPGASAAQAAGVPVLVTRSVYFPADPVEPALAVGPGLHTREGWSPAPPPRRSARITLQDLASWHAHAEAGAAATARS